MSIHFFTSESVTEGHPDKICDQISDAVLDAAFKEDRFSRVACETYVTTGLVLIGGEITTETYINIIDLARNVIKDIGYTDPNTRQNRRGTGHWRKQASILPRGVLRWV